MREPLFPDIVYSVFRLVQVAIKQVWISPRESKDIIESFRQEVAVLTYDFSMRCSQRAHFVHRALRHPNIVLFLGACPDPPNLSMVLAVVSRLELNAYFVSQVMEFIKAGNLRKLLNRESVCSVL